MKSIAAGLTFIIVLVVFIALGDSAFVVDETKQVVRTQLGKPVGKPITTPGLHFKLPFIQDIHAFDKRFLEWDGDANQVPTKDKKFIWVDTYARWQITDPLLFFQRLRDERTALSRLSDILNGATRDAVANHHLVELVRTSNRTAEQSEELGTENDEVFEKIQFGRNAIQDEVLLNAKQPLPDLGIELIDLRFKRIGYVEEVRNKVYERMITERKRIADRYRSEGAGEAARIRGEREREHKRITSEAYRTAQEIHGRADAEATRVYAEAYNRDPEFYRFLKSMESYKAAIDESTTAVLTTDNEYLQYLQSSKKR